MGEAADVVDGQRLSLVELDAGTTTATSKRVVKQRWLVFVLSFI